MKQRLVSIVTSVLTVLTAATAPFTAAAAGKPTDYTINDYTTAESFYNRVVLSKQFLNCEDRAERGEMLQLPQYMLDRMTTDALAEAVLDFPYFYDVYAFDDVQIGFDLMMEHFNGVQELADRDDVASVLLDKYCGEEVLTDEASADGDVFRLTNMEILLSQNFVMTKLSKKEKNKYVKAVASKMEDKVASPVYGDFTNNLLFDLAEENSKDGNFLKDMQGVRDTGRTSFVTTPRGTRVTTTWSDTEPLSQAEINRINSQYDSLYPNAQRQRSASGKYNCHSYAWHTTSGSNSHWMNDPTAYYTDGSYAMTDTIRYGFKAVYHALNNPRYPNGYPIHSAMVDRYYGSTLKLYSKWGQCGMYHHAWNDSPYTYYTLRFYQYQYN